MPNPLRRPLGCVPAPYGARFTDLLAANVGLIAWCPKCAHSAPVDVLKLAREHGDLMQLRTIAPRLRCTAEHCRAKGGQFFVLDEALQKIAPYR
jgi:hypothetical protein